MHLLNKNTFHLPLIKLKNFLCKKDAYMKKYLVVQMTQQCGVYHRNYGVFNNSFKWKNMHASQWHDPLTDISIINIRETLQAADSNERWMRDYWNTAKLRVSWDLCFSSPHHLFFDSSNFLYNPKDLFWNLDSHSYQGASLYSVFWRTDTF